MSEFIENELDKFLNTGTDLSDPYWALFKVKDQMNTALVEAVKYGYRRGMENNASVADRAEDSATIRYLRHREEILMTAIKWYADKSIYDNPESCPILEIDSDGEEIADEGYTARAALTALQELFKLYGGRKF